MSGSRLRGRRQELKGPVFPSFTHARPGQRQHMVFLPHTRLRAATRNLKNLCVHALRFSDEASVIARQRCMTAVASEPAPLYAAYGLMYAAWEAHDGTGCPWAECMNYLLDKFDAEMADHTGSTPTLLELSHEQSEDDTRDRQGDHEQDEHRAEG